MCKIKYPLLITALFFCCFTFMSVRAAAPHHDYEFRSMDDEAYMQVERGRAEVFLHVLIKNFKEYDHIIIERSAETPDYFGKCKYISCSEIRTGESAVLEIDKYPYNPARDVYYRLKTVTRDGIERIYPAVMLAAAID